MKLEEARPENKLPRPVQNIPLEEVERLIKSRVEAAQETIPKPLQQIPHEDIRKLLEGRVKLELSRRQAQKGVTQVSPAPEPQQVVVMDDVGVEVGGVKAGQSKPEPKAPFTKLWELVRRKIKAKNTPAPVSKVVKTQKQVQFTVVPKATKLAKQPEEVAVPRGEVAEIKPKEFIPDPPPKGKKKVLPETVKKKLEENRVLKKKMTYEEAIEQYERDLANGTLPEKVVSKQNAVTDTPAASRFSSAELRKFMVIKVLPSRIRSILARRSGVPFMLICGIYRLEFIQMVKSREEGHKIMLDLRDALNYESIMEIYTRRRGEVIAIYSRARMDQQGKYSGTPLRPRLEEKA